MLTCFAQSFENGVVKVYLTVRAVPFIIHTLLSTPHTGLVQELLQVHHHPQVRRREHAHALHPRGPVGGGH